VDYLSTAPHATDWKTRDFLADFLNVAAVATEDSYWEFILSMEIAIFGSSPD